MGMTEMRLFANAQSRFLLPATTNQSQWSLGTEIETQIEWQCHKTLVEMPEKRGRQRRNCCNSAKRQKTFPLTCANCQSSRRSEN